MNTRTPMKLAVSVNHSSVSLLRDSDGWVCTDKQKQIREVIKEGFCQGWRIEDLLGLTSRTTSDVPSFVAGLVNACPETVCHWPDKTGFALGFDGVSAATLAAASLRLWLLTGRSTIGHDLIAAAYAGTLKRPKLLSENDLRVLFWQRGEGKILSRECIVDYRNDVGVWDGFETARLRDGRYAITVNCTRASGEHPWPRREVIGQFGGFTERKTSNLLWRCGAVPRKEEIQMVAATLNGGGC